MYLGTIVSDEKKLVTAALYEAKVKDDEILRVLMKLFDIDRETALTVIHKEKFILKPCRDLYQYLILEKGFNAHDADVFAFSPRTKSLLNRDPELSKVSLAKLFDSIYEANK